MKPERFRAGLRADYGAVFDTAAGQRVLKDLYRFCRMDQPTFTPDPCTAAFNEGCRRVFLRILGFRRMSMDDVMKLSKERPDD